MNFGFSLFFKKITNLGPQDFKKNIFKFCVKSNKIIFLKPSE